MSAVDTLRTTTPRERSAAHLEMLARVSQRLIEADGSQAQAVGAVLRDLSAALGFELFFHYRPGPAPGTLRLVASGGLDAHQRVAFTDIRFGQYLCGVVAERKAPMVLQALSRDASVDAAGLCDLGARCYVGIPLLAGATLVGTASFASRSRDHIDEGDLRLIQAVCDQAAVAALRADGEARLRDSQERYRHLFDNIDQGFCIIEMIDGADGHAEDYRFIEVNRAFERHTGLKDAAGRTARELVPDLERHWVDTYDRVSRTGEAVHFELDSVPMGRLFDVAAVRAGGAESRRVTLLFSDITERRRTEERLRESEHRFRELADHAPMMVWVTEADGRCSFLSQSWCEFTGQTLEHGLGFGWLDAVHPDDAARSDATFREANAHEASFKLEYRLRGADGRYRWALDSAAPRRGADGTFLGYIGSVVDIDERRAVEERQRDSEARLRLAMDASSTGMWDWDVATGKVDWSPECFTIHGLAPGEFDGTADGFSRLLHDDDRDRVWRTVRAAVADGSRYSCEFRIVRPDGAVRWVANLGRAVGGGDGAPLRMVGTLTDITARKQAEEALKLADRRKDEFLAMLAHELRNPLAPIRMAVGALRARGAPDGAAARCYDVIERQVKQMARLLDDLLDVSRVSSGKVALRRTPLVLDEVIDAAIETSRPAIEQRRQRLTLEVRAPSLVLDGDPGRLTQVFSNLLNNAAKYGRPEGSIVVTVREDQGRAVVGVRDDGIGIAPDMIDHVFDLFVQAPDAREHAPEGLGIGLSLARRLIEMHGGTVAAASAGLGRGSEFTVTLPMPPTAGDAPRRSDAATPAIGDRRVLVVDDNVDAADAVVMLLGAFGAQASAAYGGAQAMEMVGSLRPHLVLLDLGMPGIDGFETCRRLRELGGSNPPQVVALSGWGTDDHRRRTAEAGFAGHLTKPVAPEDLLALVQSMLPASATSL